MEGPRDVTPTLLKSSTGLDVSKLSPKKWGLSGTSTFLLPALLASVSFLLNQGLDVRPNLAAILALAIIDSIFLGGSCLAQISTYWPPYRRRILVHEAGHLLIGTYLLHSSSKLLPSPVSLINKHVFLFTPLQHTSWDVQFVE